jgi:hypothetical protein
LFEQAKSCTVCLIVVIPVCDASILEQNSLRIRNFLDMFLE